MCFSAEGSLALGAALLAAGAHCCRASWRGGPRYLLLAAVPVAFGVQQLSEEVVWVGLGRSDPALARSAALVFLFFALAFWPVWMASAAARLDHAHGRRWLWYLVAALGVGWGVALYLPILSEPTRYLKVEVVHHSVRYDFAEVPLMRLVPSGLLRALYLATCAVPLLGCSDARARGFGALLALSAGLTQLAFWYAFTSVWCFFAAALALYLCWCIPSAC